MPKAKKVPKTEKVWMGWHELSGFMPWIWGEFQKSCKDRDEYHDTSKCMRVRIMPEAEYQQLRKAAKGEK